MTSDLFIQVGRKIAEERDKKPFDWNTFFCNLAIAISTISIAVFIILQNIF